MNLRGQAAEQQARQYLQAQGLRLLAQNVHCRMGEIDLIMQDKHELAIVEVRSRAAGALVDALTSISASKRQRIIKATRYWLSRNSQWFDHPLRFDVVAVDGKQVQWHSNAFDAL